MLTGLFGFGPSVEDISLLAARGVLASAAVAHFLAAGELALAGDDASVLAGWQALRRSEVAPWIGLAALRVLLRLPYSKGSDPVERLQFEEFGAKPVHAHCLWGNAGPACALLIGRAFMARGWGFEPGNEREIADLPTYTFVPDGEREMQACAEQTLGEVAGEALMVAGLMPVMSHRNRNGDGAAPSVGCRADAGSAGPDRPPLSAQARSCGMALAGQRWTRTGSSARCLTATTSDATVSMPTSRSGVLMKAPLAAL